MSLSRIAEMAGVSKATVSRVLNNSKSVSPRISAKVNTVVEKLNYHPQLRRKSKKLQQIAVVIVGRDLFMEYSPARWRILYGIQDALSPKGINVIVQQISSNQTLPASINSNTVDGIILLGKTGQKELIDQTKNIPSIWINSQGSNDKDHALSRNQLVGQMAAQYLIEQGHKRLAFFRVFTEHASIEMDGDFFAFTAQRSGCTVETIDGQKSFEEDDSLDSWKNLSNTVNTAIEKLTEFSSMPTGLFIPIGPVVVMAYTKLQSLGIKPGKDIDIIGCGCENAMLAPLNPRPANISINTKTIGKRAAEQLLWRISNPAESSSVNITVMPTIIK